MPTSDSDLAIPAQTEGAALEIVQIVPRLPPHTDGVGDYALRLSDQLWADYRIYSHFLVFKLGLQLDPLESGFSVTSLAEHSAEALLAALPASVQGIIVHYSNYPYLNGPLDAPFWLPKALKLAIQQRKLTLVVMFHELPTLKFKAIKIINPLQSQVSRQLAQLAHGVITDSARFQARLSRWTHHPIPCIPDFSTVGEPSDIPPLANRQKRLVVFGGNDRSRVYNHHLPQVLQTCLRLGIGEIIDIGRPLNLNPADFGEIRLTEMGFQPATVVSELILNSVAGMIDYTRFPGDLGKSTVFAAFTSHGTLPIVTAYNPSEGDGLFLNQHYVTPTEVQPPIHWQALQTIASRAYQWYHGHSLSQNAQVFATYLRQGCEGSD